MATTYSTTLPAVSASGFDAYLQTIRNIEILTPEQELEIANDYYHNDSVDSARKLILSHLRFVVHIARSYGGYGLPLADLVQEGNVGLMKAVKRFNPTMGVRLVSFAVHWIKAEIHEYVLKNWRMVKIATTKAQRKLFFNLRSKKKGMGWLSNDEVSSIASDLGVAEKDVREMENRLTSVDTSVDPLIDDNDDTNFPAQVYLIDQSQDPAQNMEESNWQNHMQTKLHAAVAQLDDRSRDIIVQRWLRTDEEKLTLHDLADKYNISAERVRQIEERAMNNIRTMATA